jgi:hypothetical protein
MNRRVGYMNKASPEVFPMKLYPNISFKNGWFKRNDGDYSMALPYWLA